MTEYAYPASVEEAVQILAKYNGSARVIAGGTDVLPDLRENKISPRCLVDITRVPDLDTIEVSDSFITVGAAVTFADLQKDPFLGFQKLIEEFFQQTVEHREWLNILV